MQHGVKELSAIPWGQGFSKATKEFEQSLRRITQLGYGLVILAHVDTTVEKRPDGSEVQILGPAIPKRCYNIVNQLVDVIGYIDITWDENGNSQRWLQTRKTPTVMAGSRFKYLAPRIKFGYQELVDAINDAIDKEQEEGATVVDTKVTTNANTPTLDFKALRAEAQKLWGELVHPTENPDVNKAEQITKIISEVMGTQVKLSEITEAQVDFLDEIVRRIKTEVKG